MAARNAPKKPPQGSSALGCLIWLLVLLFIFVLFFLNRGTISKVLENTKFLEVIKTSKTDKESRPETPSIPSPAPANRPSELVVVEGSREEETPAKGTQDIVTVPGKPEAPAPKAQETKPRETNSQPAERNAAEKPKTRLSLLYFVKVDEDGGINMQKSKRSIQIGDSPLESVLASLLSGPTNDELKKDFVSFIPVGTKLVSATVRGSTAVLNFNEKFMFNSVGIEGYAGQLKQVVYTATEFSNIQDVQFLIEGQKRDYLGGEGVYIGRPLSRNSF
jgi:germination protein M